MRMQWLRNWLRTVLNNDNLTVEGRITYVPVYMVMFIVKSAPSVTQYRVDISELI